MANLHTKPLIIKSNHQIVWKRKAPVKLVSPLNNCPWRILVKRSWAFLSPRCQVHNIQWRIVPDEEGPCSAGRPSSHWLSHDVSLDLVTHSIYFVLRASALEKGQADSSPSSESTITLRPPAYKTELHWRRFYIDGPHSFPWLDWVPVSLLFLLQMEHSIW